MTRLTTYFPSCTRPPTVPTPWWVRATGIAPGLSGLQGWRPCPCLHWLVSKSVAARTASQSARWGSPLSSQQERCNFLEQRSMDREGSVHPASLEPRLGIHRPSARWRKRTWAGLHSISVPDHRRLSMRAGWSVARGVRMSAMRHPTPDDRQVTDVVKSGS